MIVENINQHKNFTCAQCGQQAELTHHVVFTKPQNGDVGLIQITEWRCCDCSDQTTIHIGVIERSAVEVHP